MASFRDDPDEFQRLDWSLLQNGPITLYFKRAFLEEDVAWLVERGYEINRLDCGEWQEAGGALADLARVLRFPDYFGGNLDALNDCFGDLSVPDGSGRAIVLEHFDVARARLGSFCSALLDILASQSRTHLLLGRRLMGLVQSDDPHISLAPVGATPVEWNRREWLDKARGG
jgi:RNAse (barnase) inhibitor barstar